MAGIAGGEVTIGYAGALGLELGALVAQACNQAPVVDVQGVHQVAGVDVFAHVEVIHPRLFLVIELAAIQTAEQILHRVGADPRTERAEAVVDAALLVMAEQQLVVADAEGVNGDIRWNFEKFLVSGSGEILARFSPMITPEDPALVAAIESHLK